MYDYVDRPVASLDPGGQFLIWSMRRWVEAMAERVCPPNAIGPTFAKWNMVGALPHFHMMMMLLNREGVETFRFAPLKAVQVLEDEAVLLHLFRATCEAPAQQVRATAELIVLEDAVAPFLAALTGVALRLSEVGLVPFPPILHRTIEDSPKYE